ncbi:GNAT family N-acetyltransferase [Calditrichota bacterium]
MSEIEFKISEIRDGDNKLIANFISNNWESPLSVSRGRIHDTTKLPGFVCKKKNEIIGLVTYNIEHDDCEIVTLDSKINNQGLGTILINKVLEIAKKKKCQRVWLITTNDNTNAIKFYQKRGFE